jgi:hypothetical protein
MKLLKSALLLPVVNAYLRNKYTNERDCCLRCFSNSPNLFNIGKWGAEIFIVLVLFSFVGDTVHQKPFAIAENS